MSAYPVKRPRRLLGGIVLAGALALLSGCYDYGYGGVSAGYGVGGVYDDGFYGNNLYGPGYGAGGGYGWYDNFYYPGTGVYVFDRGGGRHRWNDRQRSYWSARRGDGRGWAGGRPGVRGDGIPWRGGWRGNGVRGDGIRGDGVRGDGVRGDGRPGWRGRGDGAPGAPGTGARPDRGPGQGWRGRGGGDGVARPDRGGRPDFGGMRARGSQPGAPVGRSPEGNRGGGRRDR